MKRSDIVKHRQRIVRLLRIHEGHKIGYKPWRQRRERHLGKVLCVECL